MEKISESVYANVEWDGGNVACINTSEGVVLVDTPMLPDHIQQCKAFVSDLNPRGVRYIINTHIHFDHIIGNSQLGGSVIMHEKMREDLFKENSTLRESFVPGTPGRSQADIDFILGEPLIPSEITVMTDLALHIGGKTLRVYHVGGHTRDSMVVYVEDDRVLITGDNVTSGVHPYKGDASFGDWNRALGRLKTFEVKTVVPGHGPICTADDIDRLAEYFQEMWDLTWDLSAKDLPEEEIVSAVHEALFTFFDVEPEMVESAGMMFDLGTRQLIKEIRDF